MKGLSKIVGGFLGFLLAGLIGAILGILVGHIFDQILLHSTEQSEEISDPISQSHNHYTRIAKLRHAYHILGLHTDADTTQVKQAYRRHMSHYHPDRLAQQSLSEDTLKQETQKSEMIKQAYEMICNAKKIH